MELYTIIRVPVLYCDNIENLEENAVTLIGKKVLNQIEATYEDDYSIRRPVYIPDFCKFILTCMREVKRGVYHFYNPHIKTTKYEMAKQIANILGKRHEHILPSDTSKCNMANRPRDTELIDTQYNIYDYAFTPLEDGLRRCFSKLIHPPLFDPAASKDFFLMFDLDGTLVDTDGTHYESYKHALGAYGVDLSWECFERAINEHSIEHMLEELGIPVSEYGNIKKAKTDRFLTSHIKFIDGAERLLEHCVSNNVNMVVVTNTSRVIVDYIISQLPVLGKVQNWITREDYFAPKPNKECYELALRRYYKNERYKIGFENSLNGYRSIKDMADCVYFITSKLAYNYRAMKKEDVYLHSNLIL